MLHQRQGDPEYVYLMSRTKRETHRAVRTDRTIERTMDVAKPDPEALFIDLDM
jgi:hypothetical protein